MAWTGEKNYLFILAQVAVGVWGSRDGWTSLHALNKTA